LHRPATRRKAITQVVGYLILENGIFIMACPDRRAAFLVEVGVLLDVFVRDLRDGQSSSTTSAASSRPTDAADPLVSLKDDVLAAP